MSSDGGCAAATTVGLIGLASEIRKAQQSTREVLEEMLGPESAKVSEAVEEAGTLGELRNMLEILQRNATGIADSVHCIRGKL